MEFLLELFDSSLLTLLLLLELTVFFLLNSIKRARKIKGTHFFIFLYNNCILYIILKVYIVLLVQFVSECL
jgi:hypothetical protein